MSLRMRAFVVSVLLGVAGCTTSAPVKVADSGAAPLDASSNADGQGASACSAPAEQRPPGATCVLSVKGTVTDFDSVPLPDVVVTFCGQQCYGTRSDEKGAFSVTVGDFVNRENYAIHADGRPDHAVDYYRLAKGDADTIVLDAPIRLPRLPEGGPVLPEDHAPASSITNGDLTLGIAADTTFELDIADFGKGDTNRTLRVAAVALTMVPTSALTAKLDAVYALAPSSAKASKPMSVTLKNAFELKAGTEVELLVLSDDYFFTTPPTVGIYQVAATGRVSSDGKVIETDPGQGISLITWLGVRQKGK